MNSEANNKICTQQNGCNEWRERESDRVCICMCKAENAHVGGYDNDDDEKETGPKHKTNDSFFIYAMK